MATKPDQGYAYVILMMSFLGHFIIFGISYSMGVFYVEFREVFSDVQGSVALIASLNTAFLFSMAPVSSLLTKRFGPQVICFVGGLVSAAALFLSSFASNLYVLYVTFGVLTGIGQALCYIPVVTIVGGYFIKRRTLAVGLAVSGAGLGNLSLSPLVQYLIQLYGWRGSCLILSGVTLHLCIVGLLLRPIPLQAKTTQVSKKLSSNSANNDVVMSNFKDEGSQFVNTSEVSLHSQTAKDSQIQPDHLANTTLQTVFSYFDLFIFKNPSFLLLCANNLFIYIGSMMIFTHLAAYGVTVGLSPYQGSLLLAFIGIGNFSGRIATGIVVNLPRISESCLYVWEFFLCGVLIAMIPHTASFIWLACISVGFGMIYGSMCAVLPQITIHILELSLLVSGYGYLCIFAGIGCLIGPPVAELLFDQTGIYSTSFYLAGAMLFLSSVLMLYPWWKIYSKTTAQVQT